MTTTGVAGADGRLGHTHDGLTHDDHHHGPAAWVGDLRVEVADVDAAVARLREGPRAALLPVAASSEGRQLRRWVTQTLVARALLEQEARDRELPEGPPVEAVLPDRMAATAMGGVVGSVLRGSGPARAVYAEVVRGVEVTAAEAEAYLERSGGPADGTRPTGPSAAALGAARIRLAQAHGRQVFLDWLSARTADLVRLEPGHEHPGDPHQPDATHRH